MTNPSRKYKLEPSKKTDLIEDYFKSYDYGQCTAKELFICLDEVESSDQGRLSQREKQNKLGMVMDRSLACYITDVLLDYAYHRVCNSEDISNIIVIAEGRQRREEEEERELINRRRFVEMFS